MADFVGMLSSLFFRGIHENSELQGALARIILLSFFRPFFLSCLLGPSPSLFFVARNAVAPNAELPERVISLKSVKKLKMISQDMQMLFHNY